MNSICIIEELWLDPSENQVGSAVGYNVVGYVQTEEEAKAIFATGRTYTQADCWAIRTYLTQYRYQIIQPFKPRHESTE